ncbi:hypothetical protein [Micromonospora sp. U21]|uniref:hypothetical protein n=1 Tax=Micromonospora sp. U21 TaxID=2824899 RepID=UPI001B367275|nr:hypothetical protein [Micromonospora sp. U21]MBQ0907058.1 hypothetical protein [Micromonospora sp. U21]
MSRIVNGRWFVWAWGSLAVAVALLAQLMAAVWGGLLPFNQSFAAGGDGEWLNLLATITGLAALTSALGGLVASNLLSGVMRRLGVIALVAAAGLTSVPFLHGRAADARNVSLAMGGPETSVTIALAVGLVLGGLAAGVFHARDGWALSIGLAVTTVAVWLLFVVAIRLPVPKLGPATEAPPIGMPSDVFRTNESLWLGGWLPLLPISWVVIGAASAIAAKRFAASQATVVLSGVLGAVLISLSYFAARPSGGPYIDHTTVQNGAFGWALMIIGGAVLGAALASRVPVWGTQGAQDSAKRRGLTANDAS